MHTLDLLEEALRKADQLGYKVRHEWLGGSGGGACEFAGQKWIFVDLALNVHEQLHQVLSALRQNEAIHTLNMSVPLTDALQSRRAA